MGWLPRISLGLTIAQLSERLRCADCGGQLHSVKRADVLGKPLAALSEWEPLNSHVMEKP